MDATISKMTNEERAYTAGLLDGEGSVVLQYARTNKGKYKSVVLTVSITNSFLPALEWVKERWGGGIYLDRAAAKRPQDWKPSFHWAVSSAAAGNFLRDVRPFVIIKREQIENALAFQATKRARNGSRVKLTEAEWEVAADFLKRQRALNARGPAREQEVTR